MPSKLKSPLKERDFYCVKCRKRVSAKSKDICIQFFDNKKRGKVPALRGKCSACGTMLTKFVAMKKVEMLKKKYPVC